MPLNPEQKKKLKSMAHHLNPLVMVGKHGVTEALILSADKALTDHELIKVKFIDHKDEKRELTDRISGETGSIMVGMVGNVAIIYRESSLPEKQGISGLINRIH